MRWLGGPSLRARLTRALVGLGLVSVILLAAVNFVVVRGLLSTTGQEQLAAIREVRADQIESGFDRLLRRVSSLGADPAVGAALAALDDGYRGLQGDITPADVGRLEAVYAETTALYEAAGADVPAPRELLPSNARGRQLQLLYVAGTEPGDRQDVIDAGDGSAYSAAHRAHHPFLRSISESLGGADVVLVSARSSDVIYSVDKLIDLGTDVRTGPHAESGLGEVLQRLDSAAAGDAVITDTDFHLPAGGRPLVHVAAVVRDGAEVTGAIVIRLELDILTDIVSSNGQWELLGLGPTGDAYLVGPDRRLRSVPRTWSTDPSDALERFVAAGGEEREVELIEVTGSPVLLASVDNAAVGRALEGERLTASVTNPTGDRVVAAAGPLSIPGLEWAVVTEQGRSASRAELVQFLIAIGLLMAVLLPLLSFVGVLLARAFARPVDPLVVAARRIAEGDYDTPVPDLGRNELGDLGQQLAAIAEQLRDQDASIAAEEDRITTMLASVLPTELVEPLRNGDIDVADVVDLGTVVALAVGGLPEGEGAEQDVLIDVTERLAVAARALAAQHGVERARVAADQQLFVTGRGSPASGADQAFAFALAAVHLVEDVGTEFGLPLTACVGLATGWVATGVLGSQQLSFGVWGDAVSRSIELSASAAAGQVLADESIIDQLADDELVATLPAADENGVVAYDTLRTGDGA